MLVRPEPFHSLLITLLEDPEAHYYDLALVLQSSTFAEKGPEGDA